LRARWCRSAAHARIALDDVNPSVSIVFDAESMRYGGEYCRARNGARVDSLIHQQIHQQIEAGEFDVNRVRAVHAPSTAWSAPSHDRIPAVALHVDPNARSSPRSPY
jgi:hypothetical protein